MVETVRDRRVDWRPWRGVFRHEGFRSLLGILVVLVFGAVILSRTDLDQVVSSLGDARLPLLAAAVLLRLSGLIFLSLRWHLLLRHIGSPGAAPLVPALAIGHMASTVLPFSLGGVVRAHYVQGRHGIAATSTLSSIAVEYLIDAVVLAGLFIPVLAIVGLGGSLAWTMLAIGGAGAGVLVLVRVFLTGRLAGSASFPLPRTLWPKRLSGLAPLREEVGAGLESVRSSSTLAIAFLLTVAARLVTVGVHWIVGIALGLDIDWTSYLVVTAAANASGFVSVSQGNVGPYEIITAEIVAGLGAPRGTATAYAILAHAVLLLPIVAAGAVFLCWHLATVPRDGPQGTQTKR